MRPVASVVYRKLKIALIHPQNFKNNRVAALIFIDISTWEKNIAYLQSFDLFFDFESEIG